jgi:hypothetical protein
VARAVHNLDFSLVTKEALTNGDQWKDHAVIARHVFDRTCRFFPIVVTSVMGLYPRCAGKLRSLE